MSPVSDDGDPEYETESSGDSSSNEADFVGILKRRKEELVAVKEQLLMEDAVRDSEKVKRNLMKELQFPIDGLMSGGEEDVEDTLLLPKVSVEAPPQVQGKTNEVEDESLWSDISDFERDIKHSLSTAPQPKSLISLGGLPVKSEDLGLALSVKQAASEDCLAHNDTLTMMMSPRKRNNDVWDDIRIELHDEAEKENKHASEKKPQLNLSLKKRTKLA
jgi:hypothetical protein